MARLIRSEPYSDDEDWSCIEDPIERRKVQNRNNQRALRRRRVLLKQVDQANNNTRRSVKPILLPKIVVPIPKEMPIATFDNEPSDGEEQGYHDIVIAAPTPVSVHDAAATGLDMDARRVFHYASTCLWVAFCQHVIETNESLAGAMTRVSLKSDLIMHTFLWTAATELETRSTDLCIRRVLLQQQNQAVAKIQKGIEANDTSDDLVFAVYSLVSTPTPAERFKERDVLPCRHCSFYGDYNPPLASVGSMDTLSRMWFDDRHANAAMRMLERRGGMYSMETAELTYQMQAYDLLRNSKRGTKPLFDLCKSYRHILEVQMPLYRAPNLFSGWPISNEFRDLFFDLRCYLRQVDLYLAKAQPIVGLETLVAWRNINQHRVLSLPSDQDQLFRLGVLIFSYNVTFPVPYRDIVQGWVRELVLHIHQSSDDSEATLWAVVVAALTAPDEEVFRCLIEKAKRVKSHLQLRKWFDLKTIMTRYLWLESACDLGGERFWDLLTDGTKRRPYHDPRLCSLTESTWSAFT